MFKYDEKFYDYIEQMNIDDEIILQFIIQRLSPKSIVDFGCGEGSWLNKVLLYDNKIDVLGLDGVYINKNRLKISEENFKAVDLRKPIVLDKEFDLAISTEVAEHLEEPFADIFVDNITNASKQILFSAAVPGQGGVHHVNEKWQSYWIAKFENRGYYCDFSLRNYFWNRIEISSWRRQNLLFFSKNKKKIAPGYQLADVVHPKELCRIVSELKNSLENYGLESYIKLDRILEKLVLSSNKIVIYPYGKNGKLCEKLLQIKYGIEDYIIADNYAVVKNKKIYKVEELGGLVDEFSVIDTCGNVEFHVDVIEQLRKYVASNNIYSAFEIIAKEEKVDYQK